MDLLFFAYLLMQLPTDFQYPPFFDSLEVALRVLFALAVRGYLLLVITGFMVYVTGLSDGFGKFLVIAGIFLYLVGPFIANLFAQAAGFDPITMEMAKLEWLRVLGMSDGELFSILIVFGDIVAAICCLAGAILYFTPSSDDLRSRGHSLIVRSLMFAPILIYFHITPWI
ncbi:MAG: conserved membrane protein of unknown function [Candidatus Thorarchaeota archaeon]|nr:MAG: conserved membrane protein of unknown function [Candidatus Thorarchaeota archaeon]